MTYFLLTFLTEIAASLDDICRLPFGAAVWASGYVVLPLLGVYKPIWKYDFETLRKDLSAHLVFGTATAVAFRLLSHGAVDR